MGTFIHKLYGGFRLVYVCKDWATWLREYFTHSYDQAEVCYRFRNGARLYTRRNRIDLHMIDEIWCFRKYDFFGFRVAPGDVVVDIGAQIGSFTVYAATVCRAGRVIAFEPHHDNFRMLGKNTRANGLRQVTPVNEAVAGQSGTIALEIDPTNAGGHKVTRTPQGKSVEVACCTLSEIVERFNLTTLDYLKMDCEGAEYEILLTAPRGILERIRRISMEYHHVEGRSVGELTRHLRSYGFTTRVYGDHRLYARRD